MQCSCSLRIFVLSRTDADSGSQFSTYITLMQLPSRLVPVLSMVSICAGGPQSAQLFLVPPVYLLRFSLPPTHKADLFA